MFDRFSIDVPELLRDERRSTVGRGSSDDPEIGNQSKSRQSDENRQDSMNIMTNQRKGQRVANETHANDTTVCATVGVETIVSC